MDFWRRTNWKIASMVRVWFLCSGIIIAVGVAGWIGLGLNYGIDFTGGTLYKFGTAQPLATVGGDTAALVGQVREALTEASIRHAQIQVAPPNLLLIRTATQQHEATLTEQARILEVLNQKIGAQMGQIGFEGADVVGAVVSADLARNALYALILGNLLILIFLSFRYEYRVALACIVALIHDVLVMVGAMALSRMEINSEFVAAMLTIVGFSVTDSVVIFDRIRENKRLHRSADLETITNASLLQTMHRSINTVLVVLFTLFSLYLLGGATLRPFCFALIVGMTCGMYSSIFIASPLVVSWDRWSRRRRGTTTSLRSRAPITVAGGMTPTGGGLEEPESGPRPGLSAEQAMRRAQNEAQEEKREVRRERRKEKSAGKGKRRF